MLDKKYNFKEKEEKWQEYWEKEDVYAFESDGSSPVYTIDTPPPTSNGNIHIGHLSSYTHIEIMARHHRMLGDKVFFPFGFDNNGLPTERYVEKVIKKKATQLPRETFIRLCLEETEKLGKRTHDLYKRAGFSCNLKNVYGTISPRTQKISQQSFIDLYKKGYIYRAEAPALWCTECGTACAQAECESVDMDSTFNYIKFYIEGEQDYVIIATTRPEMLCGVVCVFVNPNDKDRAYLLDKKLIVPHYNYSVPVLSDDKVDMEKGSGAVMCCTFGDNVDMEWQKKHNLPIKKCFTQDGRMTNLAGEFEGLTIAECRQKTIEALKEEGLLEKQEAICHAVSTHDRCGTPVEIMVKKQWFIDVLSHKDKIYQAGLDLNWHPQNMRARFLNWVEGLSWNWCISRQRYFGVTFPVWFCKNCGEVMLADDDMLPVDPQQIVMDKPCQKCGSVDFEPEVDVMDTWATSSLTPQICTDLHTGKGLDDTMTPMSLRPNAHDNIRVWDFYTIVKSLYHFDKLPWTDVMISGYVLASSGDKLAKSKGNADITPQEMIEEYSADVARYWASNLTLGRDTAFSTVACENGKKLVNKIWNASKFVLSFLEDYEVREVELLPFDKYVIEKYKDLYNKFIAYFSRFDFTLAINELEKFFWNFCDNVIEIVKNRLYKPEIYGEQAKESAQYMCYHVLLGMLKFFAPILPHITEEIYMDYFAKKEQCKSIHLSKYLNIGTDVDGQMIEKGDAVIELVSSIRQFKSENKKSLKTKIDAVDVQCPYIDFMLACEDDIKSVTSVDNFIFTQGEQTDITFGNFIEEDK